MWFINADLFIIGSNEPLTIDYSNARATFANPAIGPQLESVGIGDLTELLSCFFMPQEDVESFSEGGSIMVDDRPWAEFVAPRLIYESTVADSLKALQPYYRSPLDWMSFEGVPDAEATDAKAAIMRRHESHKVALEGTIALYGSLIGGQQEDQFMRALDVDPHDYTALSYLKDIAGQRMELFIRWNELANARAYYERVARYLQETADVHLIRSDLLAAEGDPDGAAEDYRAYREAGGREFRDIEESPSGA
jgi:hypothetical protein